VAPEASTQASERGSIPSTGTDVALHCLQNFSSSVQLFCSVILTLRICSFLLPLELVLFPVLCRSEASARRLVLGLDGSAAQRSAREQQLLFFFCAATYSHFSELQQFGLCLL